MQKKIKIFVWNFGKSCIYLLNKQIYLTLIFMIMESLKKLSSITKVALVATSALFIVSCSTNKNANYESTDSSTADAQGNIASSPNRTSSNKEKRDISYNSNQDADYSISLESESYRTDDQIQQNTEEYQKQIENKFIQSLKEPLSTFSIDVDNASYSNARRFIQSGQLPNADAVRIEEFINYFNYDYQKPTGKHPFSVSTEISTAPWNEKHKLVHVGIQGKDLDYDNLAPSNLVFLIDASGSMEAQNKLPLLRSSLKLLLTQLSKNDRIAIVAYAGAAGLVLESTPATETNKIMNALEAVSAGGSTAGGQRV